MKDDYSRSLSLLCSTCGGGEFQYEDEEGPYRCVGCDRVYGTKDELIRENGGRIDRQVEEMGEQVAKDLQKDLDKMFDKRR